ncbi:MAG: chromosome segregation protein SMC [Ignavibacteria bacterium]|jgi:chromosome segregation protein|nr:chromosome segregation protein SMC [Ignavibacteria bacterium]
MYLSKLDILGFKSFAQKTSLRFTDGISSIVGPNGAGKSNIVDAIRWVLGEQKTSVLRSDVMENVIFNGTKNRKPLGMAEVSLTIENNKGVLPSEYTEVVITRRLFRSGDSEYLLNNSKCRLKDIVELFMDTGLGSDSYSVIELKMVEAILSGAGGDRRSLFEEAAGIKKYKQQRKEATRRLNDVLADLLRVNDLMDEVRKNVNSLQRHAQKTRRYNTLNDEFRDIDTKLSYYQYKNFNSIADILNFEIYGIKEERQQVEALLDTENTNLSAIKANYQAVENELNALLEQEIEVEKVIGQSTKEVAVSNERLTRISDDEVRLKEEIANTEKKLQHTTAEITNVKERIISLETTVKSGEEQLISVKNEADTASKNTNIARNEVQQLSQSLQSINSTISTNKDIVSRNKNKIQNFQTKIEQLTNDKYKLDADINAVSQELSGRDAQLTTYINALAEKEIHLAQQHEQQANLQTQLDAVRQEISKISNDIHAKQASYTFLHNLVDTSETAKFLLNSNEWSDDAEKLMLSESIAVDEHLQSALSVVFTNYSDYYVTSNKGNASKAIALLKDKNKGKAGFICLNEIPATPQPSTLTGDGVIGWFSEVLRADDNIRNAMRLLFDGLAIVDTIDAGYELLRNNSEVKAFVTLAGEFVHRAGAILGGSIKQGETARFGKLEKMNILKDEMSALEAELATKESTKQNITEQLSHINLQAITNEIRSIETDKRNYENRTAQLKLNANQLQNNYELIDKNIGNYRNDVTELETEIEKIYASVADAELSLSNVKTEYEAKHSQMEAVEQIQRVAESKVRDSEIALVNSKNDVANAKNDLQRSIQQEQNYNNSIENRKVELIRNANLSGELNIKITQLSASIAEQTTNLETLKNKCDYVSNSKKSLNEQLTSLENEINNTRKEHEKVIENGHQKELKLNETTTWINHIATNFANNYQSDITTTTIELPEDFDETTAKATINELKQKLSGLGNINFAAVEEYEQEKERLEFLERQVADLVNAEKTLRETIDEINKTAENNFNATFTQIRLNFQQLFRKLFNDDGDADIMYDENNPLESDINIIAKPPNKRPNTIEQLSGGEKTLTAISLLFAIYLVKPSPFCILDEVDAPLDDANVGRFLNIVRDFSANTQFLVVTHNKTTMAAADTLYGVTMSEPGVSQTASVKLEDLDK